jgi:hypothetical protein
MALFLEYSDKVRNKKYPITKPVRQHASALYNALEKLVPKNNLKGLKDLATPKKYNVKGADSKNNGQNTNVKFITTDDAVKRLQRGGYAVGDAFIQKFLDKCVDKSTSQEEVSPVEPPKPTSNAVKPPKVTTKTIEGGNGTVSYNENRIVKETSNDEEHIFYEYLEDYDVYYVLDDFFDNPKGKQDWGVLINPDMYAKALREFTKYGKLINFPSKYVYQWMGIIMKNTAILEVNSALAGHREYSFSDEIADYANNRFGIEIEPDYESCYNWLEKQGLYDWMEMPDGHFAVTDYGTGPLFKIINDYNENLPPEKVLVLVNRALDVYHMQGPICSIFIQGGTTSLNKIAEEIELNKGKKVYLSEESIKRLCEYYTQLNIPFNDPNKPYDDKQNYEHFIDWLEYVGKYGQLPPSKADVSELIRAAFQDGLQHYLNDDLEDDNFIYNARSAMNDLFNECDGDEDYLRLYFNLPEEWYTNPPDNITDYLEEMDWDNDVVEMKNVLTDEGNEKFNSQMEDYFRGSLESYGFPDKMTRDERGLIYVEREIILPDIFSTEVSSFDNYKNYFELLRNSYKGSGPCWTWAVGHGEAYCGHSFGQSNTAVLLRGWVDPMSVDWGETLYRNAYSLNEERELYLKEGCIIEIDEVVVNDYGYKLNGKHILNKPMLIPI